MKMPKPHRPARPEIPALEWLPDRCGRDARVACVGGRRLLVENHLGLLEYSCECVRLSTAGGPMCVYGEGLSLSEVRADALIVRGRIQSVGFPDGEATP